MARTWWVGVLVIVALVSFALSGCAYQYRCDAFKEDFDDYIERSALPFDDERSLCYGLHMGSDFSSLPKKWAVGTLVGVSPDFRFSLTFVGVNRTGTIIVPMGEEEAAAYEVGADYRIDMNNICRHFFMMADSQSPSPLAGSFVRPVKMTCR